MFKKVLIANRGAISVRVIRTLKKMGVRSIAIYHTADKDSLHVKQADEAYCLGEGSVQETYLNQDKILNIALTSGADAIHPGYGFLSENTSFCHLCDSNNIVFLGPTPTQIEVFGLKHKARDLAKKNQVPLLPGTDLLIDLTQAITSADEIGYPVIIKSTAGGGGIGMQVCRNANELHKAFESVKRVSGNNFSNDGVFIEKFIDSARHIEVQVFGDGEGRTIALGERDCSAQRRNQKVLEETPAPNLSNKTRETLHQLSKTLLSSVQYRSAGTVEFIVDQTDESFYFLEVNTRLQVEHGVTEQVFGVDIVQWMVELGADTLTPLEEIEKGLSPKGHAIQMRLYAEDPNKNFQPSAGLLTQVDFPKSDNNILRIDGWVEAGIEVPAFFDPMLAKIISWGEDRKAALTQLESVLNETRIYGIQTNQFYIEELLQQNETREGLLTTRFLDGFRCVSATVDVLSPGTLTTIQDYPGRTGYWDIGIPPSGPFDNYAMQLANQLLGNTPNAAVLEITLNGPSLKFNEESIIVLCGAEFEASLDEKPIGFWVSHRIQQGQTLSIGKVKQQGARCYLAVLGGWQCPEYMGSKSTFTLGQFGGHCGRALQLGDVLNLSSSSQTLPSSTPVLDKKLIPEYANYHQIHVIYGPHGAPDFFTPSDIEQFFSTDWEVHYNSSRTGVRLIGPKPEWARSDGGEAGMHPSNIHDNAYAIGTIDFTGDMPVILGPDGPSLGGFVCPATVITADLWKLGQLKAGDKIRFIPTSIQDAVRAERKQQRVIESLSPQQEDQKLDSYLPETPVLKTLVDLPSGIDVVYRPSGDHYLLVEYGELVLDIALRFRVHALMSWLQKKSIVGLKELTPGIRSLQIHYDSQTISIDNLLSLLETAEKEIGRGDQIAIPSRVVHLPLSWNDKVCGLAVEKYMQSVRQNAPWCPDNLEFIRRINGLNSIDDVKKIVFDASYLVMGLGDVYLGAPVATPLDPRHRLVTTKYNPARTWTAENSVGIGGSYLCIYGMEGPGGYQFIGRTLQMWNRYQKTKEFDKPWLLRFFDQIRFYEVSHDELKKIREDFPKGEYPIKIEETQFSLSQYQDFLEDHQEQIGEFKTKRQQAFNEELQRWIDNDQFHFDSASVDHSEAVNDLLLDDQVAIESHIAGSVWKILVNEGEQIKEGQTLLIIESMKMEVEIVSSSNGKISSIPIKQGSPVKPGQALIILETIS